MGHKKTVASKFVNRNAPGRPPLETLPPDPLSMIHQAHARLAVRRSREARTKKDKT